LIAVGVVAVVIGVGGWLTVGASRPEPATPRVPIVRARTQATTGRERVRSAVALACLSAALGVLAAVGVGVVLFVLLSLLRSSIG
jgi:hypothetical protein